MGSYQHSPGSRKVKTLEAALRGEKQDFKGKLSSSNMYGDKSSFLPRLILCGIFSVVVILGLYFVDTTIETNYLRNRAEIRYRIVNEVDMKQDRLTKEQLDDFYNDMGIAPETQPTNEQYNKYLEDTTEEISY
ncbi:hypothetical protein GOV12_01130 [Candidatus Pacearchaeota archaeon]|nr:hypothetical protein [Candidatus Pacearchaeota archaeon]